MVANMSSPKRDTWIVDIGASNHINADLLNLYVHDEYHGRDRVAVGNGSGLEITHIGSTNFDQNSKKIHLNYILRYPSVSVNLLSVHQFSRDN